LTRANIDPGPKPVVPMADAGEATIRVLSSIAEIDGEVWNAIANPGSAGSGTESGNSYNPFLSHAFFEALEQSGSAVPETGWFAQHLVLERAGKGVCGLLPCYAKTHSQGEYVFDHGWADAFERAGGRYYPKLQCAVPFTPATGRRLLVADDDQANENRMLLVNGLSQLCVRIEASSAHITFMPEAEARLCADQGFLHRNDQQFHWINHGYRTFDDFLADLSSRKRKTIRKERQAALHGNGISVRWLTGADLTEAVWDRFYEFYQDTGSRKWGRPYLTREFYSRIGETMNTDIVLIVANREGRMIAGAINFIGSNTLFGRHWGCVEDHPFLHFEICYYQAIDWAIAHNKQRVEAGAQGAHKLARGYMPHITHSAHFIAHPGLRRAVSDYLVNERAAVEHESAMIARHGPFRKNQTGTDP
jgi:predicted N-acyltransferase